MMSLGNRNIQGISQKVEGIYETLFDGYYFSGNGNDVLGAAGIGS